MVVDRAAASRPSSPDAVGHSGVRVLRSRSARLLLAGVAFLAPALVGVSPSAAAPTTPELERRVEELGRDAETAAERFNEIREQLRSQREKARGVRARLAAQRRAVARIRTSLGRLAAETYRQGELSTLNMLLSQDPDAYLSQAGLVSSFAQRRENAVRRLQAEERLLVADQQTASTQQRKTAVMYESLRAQEADVEQRLARAEVELDQLRERQALAARASRNGQRPNPDVSTPVGTTCRDVSISAPSARVKRVIDFACAQLGEPYQWGAAGPDRWDCSGFTMRAWEQGGVSLPHSSRMQAGYGTPISLAEARPGDLIFKYSPISHVAIYIGNGNVIYAPQTGDVVKIAPVRDNVTAVTRL